MSTTEEQQADQSRQIADGEGFRERTEETEAHTEQVVFAG